jgi:hypothetical protein
MWFTYFPLLERKEQHCVLTETKYDVEITKQNMLVHLIVLLPKLVFIAKFKQNNLEFISQF